MVLFSGWSTGSAGIGGASRQGGFIHLYKWQPTPVFLPGESQGLRCLVDCRLWGRTE